MNLTLYRDHLAALERFLVDALERAGRRGAALDAVVLHAGATASYHADDQDIVFRPTPHFARYVPLVGPDHCLLARPGHKPRLVRVVPRDFWYEVSPLAPSYWQSEVELLEVATPEDVPAALGPLGRTAYIGNSPATAAALGIPPELCEPEGLLRPLDWHRATKTEYEVAAIESAAQQSAAGHRAAQAAFWAGASEREAHAAYLRGSEQLERDNPFETIVAQNEKSATLHYQNKRGPLAGPRCTFLLDAGATTAGYASDITRTVVTDAAEPEFRTLLRGLDVLQRELVAMVTVGRAYPEIHFAAHAKVAALLTAVGIVRASPAEALASGVTRTFLPHGVGHHLGIQVHDIGGRQAAPEGGTKAPPAEHKALRNTRELELGHVVTIEPGLYFIPMLLAALRAGPNAALVDWPLVERLVPCGGMRLEDDIVCTASGPRDLSRPYLPGPSAEP